jgi:hypothetical protein
MGRLEAIFEIVRSQLDAALSSGCMVEVSHLDSVKTIIRGQESI